MEKESSELIYKDGKAWDGVGVPQQWKSTL